MHPPLPDVERPMALRNDHPPLLFAPDHVPEALLPEDQPVQVSVQLGKPWMEVQSLDRVNVVEVNVPVTVSVPPFPSIVMVPVKEPAPPTTRFRYPREPP